MSNNQPTFAKAYEELQQLTKEFEQGNLDLELAIPKYKRASELAQLLKKRLNELETQIKEISVDGDNTVPQITTDDAKSSDIPF